MTYDFKCAKKYYTYCVMKKFNYWKLFQIKETEDEINFANGVPSNFIYNVDIYIQRELRINELIT